MYALPKGNANKLLVKTRRGVPQTLDCPTQKEQSDKKNGPISPEFVSSPKPVFHTTTSIKKNVYHTPLQGSRPAPLPPQHRELVKYIHETWKCVKKEYESEGPMSKCLTSQSSGAEGTSSSTGIKRPAFKKDFEPFDLEAFWGKRIYERLTN